MTGAAAFLRRTRVGRRIAPQPGLDGEEDCPSMILQTTDKLEKSVGNKYSLVILSAKRARQLKEGHTPLARDASPNALSLALREIDEELVQPVAPPEEEVAPAPRDVISSLVAGTDFDLDEELLEEDSDAVDDLAALLVGADDEEEEAETETDADTEDELLPAAGTDDDEEVEVSDDDEEEEADEEETVEDTDEEEE
jgi:DNA-directed RNA polymerase subunit omega